jgi:hypothetical protein
VQDGRLWGFAVGDGLPRLSAQAPAWQNAFSVFRVVGVLMGVFGAILTWQAFRHLPVSRDLANERGGGLRCPPPLADQFHIATCSAGCQRP